MDLFNGEPPASRPAWRVIEAARNQHLTGELALPSNPPTNVYLINGEVYFAERTTDGGIGVRLLVEGVITRKQMSKGSVMVSGSEHLGRLFERDESIDRHAVELCVELMTDDVLTSVSKETVDSYVMTLYKRHPSGIDRWLPNQSTADAPAVTEDQRTAAFSDIQSQPLLNGSVNDESLKDEPVVKPVVQPTVQPVVPALVVPAVVVPALVVPAVTVPEPAAPAPVVPAPVAAAPIAPPSVAPAPAPAPFVPAPAAETPELALVRTPEVVARVPERLELDAWPEAPTESAGTPTRMAQSSDSYPAQPTASAESAPAGSIADEVADAVRRALAAIDSVLAPADDEQAQ
ncbi:MAG: hypothetical protein ABL953_12545 [Ilumatobacteraceae bacterium]